MIKSVTDNEGKLLPQYQSKDTEDAAETLFQPTFTQQLKTKAQNTDIVDATVWTDGSLQTFSNGKKAYSAVYFGDNDPCNTSFRTVGRPSVFNAEAQAIEASLYCLPYCNTTIVSDSKSMTSTIKKLRNLVANSLILL